MTAHAVVSAMLLTIDLLILSTEEKLNDGRPSAELHPRWQVTVFKSGLFGAHSELQVLTSVSYTHLTLPTNREV